MKQVKEIFVNHPTEKEVHVTSDGVVFFAKNHAESHALKLENKEVTTITRDAVETQAKKEREELANNNKALAEKKSLKEIVDAEAEAEEIAELEKETVKKSTKKNK